MRAWIFQKSTAKQKHGSKAPWSVGWYDPEGRRKQKAIGCKSLAERYCRKLEGELAAGLYENESRKRWSDFRQEYETAIMPQWRSEASRLEVRHVLDTFERVAKPTTLARIDDKALARYVAARLTMRGRRKGDTVSRATIRKELRTIRAALGVARKWKYISSVPEMPSVDDFRRDKRFVSEEHFNAILAACDAAHLPDDQHYTAGDFWRALLGLAMVTGMRRGAMLRLRWDDVDLAGGTALSRAEDNKGKRDQRHTIDAVAHLLGELYRVRRPGDVRVFGWNRSTRTLNRELVRVQEAAGIHLPCPADHEHTRTCYVYTFHSFRFGFAQHNYGRMTKDQLQEQMGHRSGTTTDLYIDFGRRMDASKPDVFVPSGLRAVVEA